MEAPESANALALGFVTELLNGELLPAETLGEFREREDVNQLMALHDVVLLDPATLCELLEVDERERRESRCVHGNG
jgi:hypothetical protein